MHYNAYLNVECNSTDCFLKFAGRGRYKKLKMEIPRHQLLGASAIKVTSTGEIKEGKVNMNEEWRRVQKMKSGKKKKNAAINSFKGPDENGNFLSYAILFKDKTDFKAKEDDNDTPAEKLSDLESKEKDLQALVESFGERLEDGTVRVTMRQFGITQTHRRVRNMTSKLDSYVAKRRQKLTIRESAPANWQAILMVVFGLVGFLLSILVGLFWDENDEYTNRKKEGGPGARRRPESKKEDNPYGRQMPSRYEVSTMPNIRARSSATTTSRRR